jgi:methionine synthase I (cobalamin-dependent)
VLEVHRSYLAAGCRVLTTNTLTMNGPSLRREGSADLVREVNLAGVALAREAAGGRAPVLGNMSSTGELLEPYGSATEAGLEAAFRAQAAALLDGGVDGFILETYTSLAEALCALRACRAVAEQPVIVTLSFATTAKGGRTIMGDEAAACASALEAAGAAAVGANCGELGPAEIARIVAAMRPSTRLPLVAQPNAGKARLEGGRTLFDLGPSGFAEGIEACIESGASLVGGCCGTTPDHLRAVARLFAEAREAG